MAIKVKPEPILTETQEMEEPTPAWLHPDDDEMPPPELRALYEHLPPEVTNVGEDARKGQAEIPLRR